MEYRFDRYRNGRKMAEGLVLTKPKTVDDAVAVASRLGEAGDVFVLREDLTRLAAAEAERDAARAGEARAVEALERILVGGNHLASALVNMFEDRFPPYGTDFDNARRAFGGTDDYDLWVAWAVMMRVRDSLVDTPALDWLAQQRREAAAEALLGLKDSIRGGTRHPHVAWRCISTRAAALRATKEAK